MPKISRYLRLLLLVTAAMPLWDLAHPLWEVDDARYAEVPREMAQSGDWVTPHLNGIDYLEKPPLIYWMTALSYRAFGVSESASRIPLFLLALLGILGAAWLGSWLFAGETGIWAAILLGSCAEFSLLAHLHTPDLALTVFLLWTTGLILRALRRPEDARWAAPGAGLAMGLAFLSKGLIACLLPGVWTVSLLALFPELRRGLKSWAPAAAVLIAALVASPWLVAMASRHPGFLHHYFIEEHFMRYLTPQYNRPGPWYYFAGIDAAGLLPWTPLVFAAMGLALARGRRAESGELQLLLWVGLVFAFFTASRSKLPTYILPLFPQQCLLGARLIDRLATKRETLPWLDGVHRWLGILLLTAVPIACVLVLRSPPKDFPLTPASLSLAAGLLAAVGIAWVIPKLIPWAAFFLTAGMLIGARMAEPWLSARALSEQIRARCPVDAPLVAYDLYLHGLPFYTGRRVDRMINWVGEFDYVKSQARYKGLFGDDGDMREIGRSGSAACVVVAKRERAYFATLVPPARLSLVEIRGPWLLAILRPARAR